MATMLYHPASQPNMPAVARILSAYDRESLEAFLSVALDLLDTMDGDPDTEPNGDELDGTGGEDDFIDNNGSMGGGWHGPGCPVADAGEDDDPPEDSDSDHCLAGDDAVFSGPATSVMLIRHEALVGSEEDAEDTEVPAFVEQRKRIRRTRCYPRFRRWRNRGVEMREVDRYTLLHSPRVPTKRQIMKRKRGVPRRPRA